jgi:hypothetical protein
LNRKKINPELLYIDEEPFLTRIVKVKANAGNFISHLMLFSKMA